MRDAWDILDVSIRTGQAGRKTWWLNEGRLDRQTRQARGFITISLPRGDGTRETFTQRKLAAVANELLGSLDPSHTDQRG
eukprot:1972559-Pyramimonas_sp.AAC.1